jgi:AcrR family transcriptional regulator
MLLRIATEVNACWPTLVGMGKKSDQTKTAILAAALDQFAESGFEGATIRAIAADANIDPSMVMRYFGSKDQLFAAVADFDLRFPDLSGVAPDELGSRMVAHFFDRWEGDDALIVLLRSSATNAEAAQRMREIFVAQLLPAIKPLMPDDAPYRAGLIATQILGMALCRFVLRLPPVVDMSRDAVIAWLGPTLQRYLREEDVTA